MTQDSYNEFQTFISRLCSAVAGKLSPAFPSGSIEQLRAALNNGVFQQAIFEIKKDWRNHVSFEEVYEKRETLISVLFINLLGPLNRLPLPQNVERHKLIHDFFSTLAVLLEHEEITRHFVGLSLNVMKAA